MKKLIPFAFTLSLFVFSCNEKEDFGKPNIKIASIHKDFGTWWNYYGQHIALSSEFVAIDPSSEKIEKELFLKNLTTGDFIPVKLENTDSLNYYQLVPIDKQENPEISKVIKQVSLPILNHFRMEGKPFPDFSFTDLEGKTHTNKNTRGKNLIIKTWFVNCLPCIAEMPDLNEFVEIYGKKEDVIFLSLALDSPEDLNKFLEKTEFKYAVVPNQKDFIAKVLKFKAYPTHLIVNKEGLVQKVFKNAEEMMVALDSEGFREIKMKRERLPPPPPPPPTSSKE